MIENYLIVLMGFLIIIFVILGMTILFCRLLDKQRERGKQKWTPVITWCAWVGGAIRWPTNTAFPSTASMLPSMPSYGKGETKMNMIFQFGFWEILALGFISLFVTLTILLFCNYLDERDGGKQKWKRNT